MFRPHLVPSRCRSAVLAATIVACLAGGGCAVPARRVQALTVLIGNSPMAEEVALVDAWRLAENYVAEHPGCQALVGSGASMLPLYADRTVLVVKPMGMSELKAGMTVVFVGDNDRPVAHVLVERLPKGWVAMGVGNREPDRTLVRSANYLGTVIKAFAPISRVAPVTDPVSIETGRWIAASQSTERPRAWTTSAADDQ